MREYMPAGQPVFGAGCFLSETAYVCGRVTFGVECSIWPGVVIRADISPITIGDRVNIQDGTIIHTQHGVPLDIEDDVSFGHRAVAHCRRIGCGTLVGIGSILLDGCTIGRQCLIAAGAVLTPETHIGDGQLVIGMPARAVRPLNDDELDYLRYVSTNYLELSRRHGRGDYPRAAARR